MRVIGEYGTGSARWCPCGSGLDHLWVVWDNEKCGYYLPREVRVIS